MENVVVKFNVNNDELVDTIELLEKMGKVENGVAEEYRKASASRKQYSDEAQKSTENAIKSTEKVKKGTKELNDELKLLGKTIPGGALSNGMKGLENATEKSVVKVKSLRLQLREMMQQLGQMDEGSVEFHKLSKAAGELSDKVGDISSRVKNLGSDTKGINALLSGMQGVTGAFAVAEGSMALFGSSNENIQKSLLKVNALMAIMQGLQQIQILLYEENAAKSLIAAYAQEIYTLAVGTSVGAMKAFKLALIATGVGAFIVLIGILTSKFMEMSDAQSDAIDIDREYAKALDERHSQQMRFADEEREQEHKDWMRKREERRKENEEKLKELSAIKENSLAKLNLLDDSASKELAILRLTWNETAGVMRDKGVSEAVITETYEKKKTDIREKYNKIEFDNILAKGRVIKLAEDTLRDNDKKDKDGQTQYLEKVLNDRLSAYDVYYSKLSLILKGNAIGDVKRQKKLNLELLKLEEEKLRAQLDALKKGSVAYNQKQNELLANSNEQAATISNEKMQRIEDEQKLITDSVNALQSINNTALSLEINRYDEMLQRKTISKEEYDRKVLASKQKAAKTDKELAIFNVLLSTAVAVMKALESANIPLSIAVGITGAAELASIVSRPIPQFAKGTKDAPAGFKWVGEQGAELISTSGGETIMPHKKSIAFAQMFMDMPNTSIIGNGFHGGGISFDYLKLGRVIAKEIRGNSPEINISIKNEMGIINYNKERYGR